MAEFIDTLNNGDIIGTLAGDNTVLIIPRSQRKTAARRMRRTAGSDALVRAPLLAIREHELREHDADLVEQVHGYGHEAL